ncbi:MAG TPA: hypothetical protein VH661_00705 [Candidatus Dormibacteraeota bacterium]|nr:hypothetical protein [Candidatus Dormibacteraeota bacterium]
MRLRAHRVLALTAGSAALLACASCSSGTTIGPGIVSGTPNAEAAKDAGSIFADSIAAMAKATSVHLKGPLAGIFFDADVGKGNFTGTADQGGKVFNIVYLADPGGVATKARIFIKAPAAVWAAASSPAIGACVGGAWLTLDPATSGASSPSPTGAARLTADAGQLGDLASFANALGTSPGVLTKGATGTADGTPVIAIKSDSGASVFVATAGPPYLLRLSGISSGQAQSVEFTNWNGGAQFTAPTGARPLTTVLAGCPSPATPGPTPTP